MRSRPPAADRFNDSFVVDDNGCWLWTREMTPAGHGRFAVERRPRRHIVHAHRWAYEQFVGPTDGREVQHICGIRRCVNPSHLKLGGRAGLRRPAEQRFLNFVAVDDNGCWLWTGALTVQRGGYGVFSFNSRLVQSHRWAYQHWTGPIPDGYQIDHLCRVPRCVNPAHLEAVTPSVNVRRSTSPATSRARHAAQTHCKHGHPYNEENTCYTTSIKGYPRRICRICNRIRNARRYQNTP